jgi:DegV family protein with EDD domain
MSNLKVAIVTDSTANLPDEIIAQYNIHVVPLNVNWGGQSYQDGIDITPAAFYERLKTDKESPTTSQPSAGQFEEVFSNLAESFESIVGIFVSEPLSGTLDSARTAASTMPDFPLEIIDSRSISFGLGYMVLAAARAAQDGQNQAEIAQAARNLINLMRFTFVVETLEYLHRGGRIGGAQRLLGSVLSIKPLLHLEDGKVEALESIRTKRKAVNRMLDIAIEDTRDRGDVRAAILHASAPQEAEAFRQVVEEKLNPVELMLDELTPVIGTHVGPGTIGLVYYAEGKE